MTKRFRSPTRESFPSRNEVIFNIQRNRYALRDILGDNLQPYIENIIINFSGLSLKNGLAERGAQYPKNIPHTLPVPFIKTALEGLEASGILGEILGKGYDYKCKYILSDNHMYDFIILEARPRLHNSTNYTNPSVAVGSAK